METIFAELGEIVKNKKKSDTTGLKSRQILSQNLMFHRAFKSGNSFSLAS